MRHKAILSILAAFVGLLLTAATATPANTPEMQRTVIAGGGKPVSDGVRFVLRSTIGEPVVGPPVTQADRKVASGYWQKLPGDYQLWVPQIKK